MPREELIQKIRTADDQDDTRFTEIIAGAVNAGVTSDIDLAHEFGTSYPTARRWIQGVSCPHPAMRKCVYGWILKRLSQ